MLIEEVLGNVKLTLPTRLILGICTCILSRVKGEKCDDDFSSILGSNAFSLIYFF